MPFPCHACAACSSATTPLTLLLTPTEPAAAAAAGRSATADISRDPQCAFKASPGTADLKALFKWSTASVAATVTEQSDVPGLIGGRQLLDRSSCVRANVIAQGACAIVNLGLFFFCPPCAVAGGFACSSLGALIAAFAACASNCFPADAVVTVQGAGPRRMDQLQYGDKVREVFISDPRSDLV